MTDKKEKPKPGTWDAIVRSTEPWNWKKTLNNFLLTPEKLARFIEEEIRKNKENRK